jgi:hypothetical protein
MKQTKENFAFDYGLIMGGPPLSFRHIQVRILSHGLRFLYKLATSANTELCNLLDTLPLTHLPVKNLTAYSAHDRWLTDAFETCLNPPDTGNDSPVLAFTEDEYLRLIPRSSVVEDIDTGPEEAWLWAYREFPLHRTCNDYRVINCRRFGYVFWDQDKIRMVNFLNAIDVWRWRWLPERGDDWRYTIDEDEEQEIYD